MSQAPAAPAVEIPQEARDKARQLGWEEGLIELALARGHTLQEVWQALQADVDGPTAKGFLESEGPPALVRPEFRWMEVPTEWGIKARPTDSAMGLTIGDINQGTYGDIPDVWSNRSEIARGSFPRAVLEDMGYTIFEKGVIWADAVVPMYEEAIRDRWAPATDLRWGSLEALPDDIERAVCQLMTELSERSYYQGTVLGRWLPDISYGFLEAKLFLATVIYELGKQSEAFRKRALSNGGGLGLQAPTDFSRAMQEARSFPELMCDTFLSDSVLLTLFRNGDRLAQNQLERDLYAFCAKDRARHVAYNIQRLKHYLFKYPERRAEQSLYLNKAEYRMGKEWQDSAVNEPLAILLGGGRDNMEAGMAALRDFRRLQLREYVANLAAATLQRPHLSGRLQALLDEDQ